MKATRKVLHEVTNDAAALALSWLSAKSEDQQAEILYKILDLPPIEMITLGYAFSKLRGGGEALGKLCSAIESLDETTPTVPEPSTWRDTRSDLLTPPPSRDQF